MVFVTGLAISTNWKSEIYNSILVIVDWLTKIVYHKLVKITINTPISAEIIIKTVVHCHSLLSSIISDRNFVFTSKFWSLLCYLLEIKQRLSIPFYPQTEGQTEMQNSIMEAYSRVFVN